MIPSFLIIGTRLPFSLGPIGDAVKPEVSGLSEAYSLLSNDWEKSVRYLFCKAPRGPLRGKRYRTLISRTILSFAAAFLNFVLYRVTQPGGYLDQKV